jgi:hypothetical protein
VKASLHSLAGPRFIKVNNKKSKGYLKYPSDETGMVGGDRSVSKLAHLVFTKAGPALKFAQRKSLIGEKS